MTASKREFLAGVHAAVEIVIASDERMRVEHILGRHAADEYHTRRMADRGEHGSGSKSAALRRQFRGRR